MLQNEFPHLYRFETSALFHKKIQQDTTMYQKFIISYLCEAQNVQGDTPPIIRNLKLH
jgi:hypothetical protein